MSVKEFISMNFCIKSNDVAKGGETQAVIEIFTSKMQSSFRCVQPEPTREPSKG